MTGGRSRWIATAYGVGCVVVALAGTAIIAAHLASGQPGLYESSGFTLALGTWAAGLGLLLLLRRPSQRLGWIVALLGATVLLQTLVDVYAAYSVHVHALPGAPALFVLDQLPSSLLLAQITATLLLFPTGALPSARWSWLGWAIVVDTALALPGRLTGPAAFDSLPRLTNPLHLRAPVLSALASAANIASIVLLLLAVSSVIVRWRHGDTATHDQIKWLVAAAGIWPVVIAVLLLTPTSFSDSRWGECLFALPIAAMLAAIAVAVLRYRLYEIDRIISRSLSYAVVTGMLVAAYVGCVALCTRALPLSSSVAVAIATLVVASAFNPLRRKVQVAVDRRFNRERYDAARTIDTFAVRLRDEVDPDAVRADLIGVATATVVPATLSLWTPAEATRWPTPTD